MTSWLVTGSRPPRGGYTSEEKSLCCAVFARFQSGDTLVTGGCIGVDSIAMRYAHDFRLRIVTILPIKRDYTDVDAVRLYSDKTIETSVGYWARDKLEVDRADKVIALPLYSRLTSSPRSGTWHTWDVGGQQNKQSVLLIIRPERNKPFIFGPDSDKLRSLIEGLHSEQISLL